MGAGLQGGLEQLKGEMEKNKRVVKEFKIGQEDLRRATWWGRLAEVTEEVTVTETCTRETRRQVTEYTETREITELEERLHGVEQEEEADTHTHTQVARDNGGELAERVGTRCEQLGVLPREQGEGVCPLEAGHGQVNSVMPRETGARGAWGV